MCVCACVCVRVRVCSVVVGVSIYLLKGTFQVHSAKLCMKNKYLYGFLKTSSFVVAFRIDHLDSYFNYTSIKQVVYLYLVSC